MGKWIIAFSISLSFFLNTLLFKLFTELSFRLSDKKKDLYLLVKFAFVFLLVISVVLFKTLFSQKIEQNYTLMICDISFLTSNITEKKHWWIWKVCYWKKKLWVFEVLLRENFFITYGVLILQKNSSKDFSRLFASFSMELKSKSCFYQKKQIIVVDNSSSSCWQTQTFLSLNIVTILLKIDLRLPLVSICDRSWSFYDELAAILCIYSMIFCPDFSQNKKK